MARLRRDIEPPKPSGELPGELARFDFQHWAGKVIGTEHAKTHGALGEWIAAEQLWRAALNEWAKDHELTTREARALVVEPPNWNALRQALNARVVRSGT
jgi:hypothetical protein